MYFERGKDPKSSMNLGLPYFRFLEWFKPWIQSRNFHLATEDEGDIVEYLIKKVGQPADGVYSEEYQDFFIHNLWKVRRIYISQDMAGLIKINMINSKFYRYVEMNESPDKIKLEIISFFE